MDAFLAFYVDEDEVVGRGIEEVEGFGGAEGGVDFVAGEAEDLVAEGSDRLAAADVEDGGLVVVGAFHLAFLSDWYNYLM